MIIGLKASESGNPVEANLDNDRFHNPGVFPSPQMSSSESNASGSSYPPPDHPPPDYSHEHPIIPNSAFEKAGLAPGQPQSIQLSSSSAYSSPSLNSTYDNYPTFSSHPYATYANSTEPSAPFSRQAPQKEYPSFEPTFLIASGQFLTHGFPALPPPSRATPHPFASHDVTESDWMRFLEEVKKAGRLTGQQEQWARLPIVSILPIVGSVSTHVIRQQMKKGKAKDVVAVINHWNHHFFNSRHIEVVLMHGVTRLGAGTQGSVGSTPGWSGTSLIQKTVISESGKEKGKAKKEEDATYRLFIMPFKLYTHRQ